MVVAAAQKAHMRRVRHGVAREPVSCAAEGEGWLVGANDARVEGDRVVAAEVVAGGEGLEIAAGDEGRSAAGVFEKAALDCVVVAGELCVCVNGC